MKNLSVTDRIKEGAKKYVLQYALFRPESAIVIALTILLSGASALGVDFIPGQWWMYLIGGMIGESALIYTTLKDSKFIQHVMSKLFTEQFDLGKIRSLELRGKVVKAIEYRASVAAEIARKDDGILDDRLRDATRDFDDWIAQVYNLAVGLDNYQSDALLARDFDAVPRELAVMQQKLLRARDTAMQPELERTVQMKQQQFDALEKLHHSMEAARARLDETLAAMGTVYSQTRLIGTKEANNARAQRLSEEMREQVRSLQDTQSALEEVYSSRKARLSN